VFAGVRKESDAQKIRDHKIKNLHPIMMEVTDPNTIKAAVKQVEAFLRDNNLPFAGLVRSSSSSSSSLMVLVVVITL